MKCNICKYEMNFVYGWNHRPDKYTCIYCRREIWLESSTIPIKIFKEDDYWKTSIDLQTKEIKEFV